MLGVKAVVKRVSGTGPLPYTDDEVGRLLALARRESNPARRWLPWLAALTGARIGELAQAWGSQFVEVEGVPVIHIRPAPDGGSLKNVTSERTVPLHSALIDEGLLWFVRTKGDGPLFYSRSSGRAGAMHASKGTANHVGAWIRSSGFDDPRKAPAHALRHWAKSAFARAGVAEGMADAIQGHAGRSIADVYRHYDVATLARAVDALPVPVRDCRN